MDDVSKKREALIAAYPSKAWKRRVVIMPEAQVTAVFLRLRSQGKV